MKKKADILIVGSGAAGLYCALNFPRDKKIIVITKDAVENSDSYLAQGGICVLKSEEDYDSYYEDTMRAGHHENRRESVDIMIRSSRNIIDDLILHGVDFKNDHGSLVFTREGGHSTPRILFHEDITGKEITGKMLAEAKRRRNITIYEHTEMVDLLCENNTCYGVVVADSQGKVMPVQAKYTVLACGGIGGLYRHSTNFAHLTGDGVAVALRRQVRLQDLNFVQIHPTTLYSERPGRRFLISESVRGEGAVLYNAHMERFVDELLPRDVVAHAIEAQMQADGKPYVWLSMEHIPKEKILSHFPNICKRCLEEGYDVTKECVPVVPGQHYFMGGVQSDLEGRTSMERLYAVGETSCNGVHGENRLASNSLLESLVFARRAAIDIASGNSFALQGCRQGLFAPDCYTDLNKMRQENRDLVHQEIERMEKEYEQRHNHEVKCG